MEITLSPVTSDIVTEFVNVEFAPRIVYPPPCTYIRILSLSIQSFGLMSSSDGPFWSAAVQIDPQEAGAAAGILNTGSNVGGFIAPVLTPVIASILGWTTALYFACGAFHPE